MRQRTVPLRNIKPIDKQLEPVVEEYNIVGPDLTPIVEKMKQEYPIISQTNEYKECFYKTNPLVTVMMTTYNQGDTLVNYSLKSILDQTYKNLQIIVVADHSTDNTDILMSKINDSRLTYINLKDPPRYPGKTKRHIWLIAGSYPFNKGLELAEGDFLTHCDHDDAFTENRIEKLVEFIQKNQCDLIHHPFYLGTKDKLISYNDSKELICGKITTSAVFYHHWFKQLPTDINCWKIDEPGDWNRYKKFKEIGAKILRYPDKLTYKK